MYTPDIYRGTTLEELEKYVLGELQKLTQELQETTALELRPRAVEPTKPREGMIVFADGGNWNPGGGAGVYARTGAIWVKL
jgi:hypothetical protein